MSPKIKRQSLSRLYYTAKKSTATQHTKSSQLKLDGSLRRSSWQMVQSLYFDWPNVYREEVQNRFVSKFLSPRTKCINLVLVEAKFDSCLALMLFTSLKSPEANENPRIISSNPTHLKQNGSHHRMRKVLQLEKKVGVFHQPASATM